MIGQPTSALVSVSDSPDIKVVTISAKDKRIAFDVSLAPGFPGGDQAFAEHVRTAQAIAAINGAYFSRDNKYPIGDIVKDGRVVHQGRMGTALAIDREGQASVFRVIRHKTWDWSRYRTVLACGPALVLAGDIDVDYRREGFRDPAAINPGPRQALGVNGNGDILMVAMRKSRTFEQAATVMKNLGCVGALNLDSGASAALYANGKTLAPAGRKLPVVFIARLNR